LANKVRGIRCGSLECGERAFGESHNNANVISMGGRMVSDQEAINIVDIWLSTAFDGGAPTADEKIE